MKPEYLDMSDAASEAAINTLTEILRVAKVKFEKSLFNVTVFEPALPAAIKVLYKSGFHLTAGLIYPSGAQPLTLRRLGIIVEVDMPHVIFGGYSKTYRKSIALYLRPKSLSIEGKIAKTQEDSQIDISYDRILAIYKEREELNAWREYMQYALPKDRQIVAFINLLGRCIDLHRAGSAVDRDRFEVRWGDGHLSKGKHPAARLIYIPSTGSYEIDVKIGAFKWSAAGSDFDYLTNVGQLKLAVDRHIVEDGYVADDHWLNVDVFNDRLGYFANDIEV